MGYSSPGCFTYVQSMPKIEARAPNDAKKMGCQDAKPKHVKRSQIWPLFYHTVYLLR